MEGGGGVECELSVDVRCGKVGPMTGNSYRTRNNVVCRVVRLDSYPVWGIR